MVGPYRLLEKIAEGGMGEIWLADQKQPVRRRVALKLIKAGMDSREIVRRFESERQALALMDHPAIATVFDAGSTQQGVPYFAMEYVPGVPITTYCSTHKLSVRQRIELFIHVCEGVQHAHQKAIIHRDLKPSNILVMEVDRRPAPKIIDFGVAKALSQRLIEQTMFTRVGSIVGTPEYMSPEQADSGGEDIDTRSDVYSLGVILYELLAGVPPIELKSSGYYDFVRKLRETNTPKPSTRVRGLTSSSAPADGGDAARLLLAKELRGDLDCIALKCLEKDRSRRYGSPAELAADLQRYLEHRPVLATPASTAYRLRKFAQRNRGLLAAVCGLVAVMILGTVISLYQAFRAHQAERAALQQRDRADTEAATAAAVSGFLQDDLLSQAGADAQNGDAPPDPDVKVRTLVDRAAAAVPRKFAGKPMVEADLRETLGNTYLSLGLLKEAESELRQAHEIDVRTRGADAQKTLETEKELATVEFNENNYPEAARMEEAVYDAALKKLGPEAPLTLGAMQSLAVDETLLGETAKAEPLLKKALELETKLQGQEDKNRLDTSDSLAFLYMKQGRYGEAQQLLESGLPIYRKVWGPDHPNTQREIFGLARVDFYTGNYAKAEELAAAVYQSNLRLLGPTHFKTLSAARQLARIYAAEGKLDQAEPLTKDTLQKDIQHSGNDSVETLYTKEDLAWIYEHENKYPEAETLLRQVELVADRLFGASNPEAIFTKQLLAANLLHQGRCEQAAPFAEQANERWKSSASTDWRQFHAQSLLGAVLACRKDFAGAEGLLLSGYKGLKESAPRTPAIQRVQVKDAAGRLAELYTAWDKPDDAQKWREVSGQS